MKFNSIKRFDDVSDGKLSNAQLPFGYLNFIYYFKAMQVIQQHRGEKN